MVSTLFQNKSKNFGILLFALIFGIFLIAFSAQAYVASGVYITDISLSSLDFNSGDTITGSYSLWNSEEYIVPDISQEFMIFIPDEEGFPKIEINKVLAKEKLLLSPGERKTINFSYQLPKNLLSGTYTFRISLFGGTGTPLPWADKEINIAGNEIFLEISNPRIVKNETEFFPLIGVNFSSNDSPKIRFEILNRSPSEILAVPKIVIFERQTNLQKVKEFEKEILTLLAGEKKTIDYEMPKLEKPEAYVAELKFYDSSGNLVSNSLFFRWIIEGKGANVLAVETSQSSYSKGDLAKVNVCYVGPADGFKIGEGDLLVEIYNEKGEVSGSVSKSINLDEEKCILLEIPIEKEVKVASVKTTISQAGERLKEYKTGPLKILEEVKPEKKEVKPEKKINSLYILITIIVLLIVGFIIYKFLKKHESR